MSGVAIWTAEQDAELLALWRRGLTGTQVGKEINRSRNAVLGRLWRLKEGPRERRARAVKPPKPKPVVVTIPKRVVEHNPHAYRNVGLLDARADQCREIVGHDGLAIFCGALIVDGSYCAHHAAINYIPYRNRRAA